MISDEEIDNLPDEPQAAFIEFERILRAALEEYKSNRNYSGWEKEREYVTHILQFDPELYRFFTVRT